MKEINIYTDRLRIRKFCEKDADAYFQLLRNPKVNCFVGDRLGSIEQARNEILMKKNKSDSLDLAVCLKDTDEFIGTLFGIFETDTFSVCWNFLQDYFGKGYAYESARAYFDFLFEHMNVRRIYAYVEEYNISSQRLCHRLGMRQEGLFKEYISFVNAPDGTPLYENTMQFAILKKEWNKIST